MQSHDTGESQAVHLGIQGTDAVGELRGQHGDDLVGKIDRGTPLPGLHIQGRTHGDIVAHIGDVNAEDRSALLIALQRDGVIQIFCAGAVDGDDAFLPEIQTAGPGRGGHLLGSLPGLFQHLRRKFPLDMLVKENGLHGGLPAAVPAEDLQQGAHGRLLGGAIAGHLDRRPVPGVGPVLAHDLDGLPQLVPRGDQPGLPAVLAHRAGDGGVAPSENGCDFRSALFTRCGGAGIGTDGDGVSVPGAVFRPGRDEIVLFPSGGPLGGDEAEAPSGGLVESGDLRMGFCHKFSFLIRSE